MLRNLGTSRGCVALLLIATLAGCAVQPPRAPDEPPVTVPVRPPAVSDAPAPAPSLADTDIHISAVGDIMLDGTSRPVLQEYGYDYPFSNMRALFQHSQVVIGNLEGPLTTRGTAQQDKTYTFRSPPDKVSRALARAGFNVVTLANNHTLDYGADGLAETIAALDEAGIQHVGAGPNLAAARRAALLTINGQRLAFLGYSVTLPETFYATSTRPGTAFAYEEQVRADVSAARAQADIVIVSFHWGQEGKTELRDYQPRLGHIAIDAGAQVVLGHHPHILQAVEHYKDGLILYSLGNFTFGSYSKKATRSAVAQLTFSHGRVTALRMVPILVDNFEVQFQPRVLAGPEADAVITTLQQLSALRHTSLENVAGAAQLLVPQTTARAP
jgi:poly-gamma-glutamate synthesis protein (capsule biosynthesis protein)